MVDFVVRGNFIMLNRFNLKDVNIKMLILFKNKVDLIDLVYDWLWDINIRISLNLLI